MRWLLGALCAGACAGDDFETRRQAALAIAECYCAGLVHCGDIPAGQLGACVELGVSTSCAGLDCNASPGPDVRLCLDALERKPCGGADPVVCVGVL